MVSVDWDKMWWNTLDRITEVKSWMYKQGKTEFFLPSHCSPNIHLHRLCFICVVFLSFKDANSRKQEAEWKEKAVKELEEWYARQDEQLQKTKANNRLVRGASGTACLPRLSQIHFQSQDRFSAANISFSVKCVRRFSKNAWNKGCKSLGSCEHNLAVSLPSYSEFSSSTKSLIHMYHL